MFVRGDWTRRGLGRAILETLRARRAAEGFTTLALMATLPGEPLYRAYGFRETGRTMVLVPDGTELAGVAMSGRAGRPDHRAARLRQDVGADRARRRAERRRRRARGARGRGGGVGRIRRSPTSGGSRTCGRVCAGHDLVLVGNDRDEDELARLMGAIGAEDVFVVRLQAAPDTLAERIIAREPPHWSGLAALVEHARAMPPVPGADLVLSTEGERAEDVAARIRETAGL